MKWANVGQTFLSILEHFIQEIKIKTGNEGRRKYLRYVAEIHCNTVVIISALIRIQRVEENFGENIPFIHATLRKQREQFIRCTKYGTLVIIFIYTYEYKNNRDIHNVKKILALHINLRMCYSNF